MRQPIPIDSTDAREQRELEAERVEAELAEDREHAAHCHGGFLGEDAAGRPRPCPRCKPHTQHVGCRTCGVPYAACSAQIKTGRGACCPGHDHSPAPRAVRQEDTTDATPQPSPEADPQAQGREDAVHQIREVLRRTRQAGHRAENRSVTAAATPEQLDAVPVLPARVINSVEQRERAFRTLVVDDPDHGAIHVRWRVKADQRAWRWKCDLHGMTTDPDCVCAWSAAIHLAENLLGLTRLPALQPVPEGLR